MNTQFLLPHKFKKPGWILLIIGVIAGILMNLFEIEADYFGKAKVLAIYSEGFFTEDSFFKIIKNGLLDEIISIFIIIGGILVGFCKTKDEDEFISSLRLSSLVWSVYVNYGILLFAIVFIFDMTFMNVMIYNLFTMLLFFIIRFHILLHKANRL
ncbi:MAG: hypothetical protein HRT68_06205 [Flavobacteriaceae bacterium]|nr:hypothetical protein [Flavobacteriaceae bacterium]